MEIVHQEEYSCSGCSIFGVGTDICSVLVPEYGKAAICFMEITRCNGNAHVVIVLVMFFRVEDVRSGSNIVFGAMQGEESAFMVRDLSRSYDGCGISSASQ